jgi:hypothetical protein
VDRLVAVLAASHEPAEERAAQRAAGFGGREEDVQQALRGPLLKPCCVRDVRAPAVHARRALGPGRGEHETPDQ